jgi:hypothetical protein
VRIPVGLPAVAAALALAGCGGSSSKPPAHTSSTATLPPHATHPPPTPSTTTTRTTTPTPAATSTTGASGVRLPATFTIGAGEKLSPPTVSAPSGVTVQLTVIAHDGRPHRVEVASRRLAVPAGGSASALLSGLRKVSYAVVVDGVKRGALVIGVQPGP